MTAIGSNYTESTASNGSLCLVSPVVSYSFLFFSASDACKRCCRVHLNDTCFAYDPTDILPDGTPCVHGFCNNVSLLEKKNGMQNLEIVSPRLWKNAAVRVSIFVVVKKK